jgi:hypothetical protein
MGIFSHGKGLDGLDRTLLIDIRPVAPPYDAGEGIRCPVQIKFIFS